jgi:hypothetical protein
LKVTSTKKRFITVLFAAIFAAALFYGLAGCARQEGKSANPGSENPETVIQEGATSEGTASEAENPGGNPSDDDAEIDDAGPGQDGSAVQEMQPIIDYQTIKPNEAGKIMVVMFHNFVSEYKSGDKEYTTTFNAFDELLQLLYDMDYRLVNLNDMIRNNIDVPAGKIPMVFTFDDGTAGQFNLVETEDGLVANRLSAVGIMEEFNKTHPDFGLKGTFFVNLAEHWPRGLTIWWKRALK